ncbi:GmrSD restriction endonuclease domain-containing protein [Kineococcus sp. G2]|uniref:GmrSD restriction endonuclease domain-containing protein n=1 Tax=Kineococcus sp. G2 TaxID=3127484 RepID=UPI00301BCAA1
MAEQLDTPLESDDPSEKEEDLGTIEPLVLSDDLPAVTPVTETVQSLLTSVAEGYVVTNPPYQRRPFWDRKKKAALIESVYLGLPLPLVYLADATKEIDGESVKIREVVDGQQRLTSLRDFYEGKLTIPEDSIIEDLRGKKFIELRPSLKQVFKEFKLSTATIPLHAKADKFELFRRLNQQSTVLSDQELRNAAHHGEYLTHIKTAAESFKDQLRVSDGDFRRMKDVEYLTRLLAFERKGYIAFPNKKLNKFLNEEMIFGKNEKDTERTRRLNRVKKGIDRSIKVFGDLRFRPYRIPEVGYHGEWARTVNRALMEAQVYALLDHAQYGFADAGSFDTALNDRRDHLLDAVRRLHSYNERFNDAIQRGTTGTPNVTYRFERYIAAVAWALDTVEEGRKRRFFSPQQKQNLWDALETDSPVCVQCGNPLTFADCEVDHIKPWSQGGETVEDNGQLLHIACNRSKGAQWDPAEEVQ